MTLICISLMTHDLEKEMATHSSVLAWRIPGTGEPVGLPSMGSHRVGHDWCDLAAAAAAMTHDVNHIFAYLPPVYLLLWTVCSNPFLVFKIGLSFFWVVSFLHKLWIYPLLGTWFVNTVSQSVTCLFISEWWFWSSKVLS